MATSHCSPYFVAVNELSLACTYALTHTGLAIECCQTAIGASIRAHRPDITFQCTCLLAALTGGI